MDHISRRKAIIASVGATGLGVLAATPKMQAHPAGSGDYIKTFDTVSDMTSSSVPADGDTIQTLGYHTAGDGGEARYHVMTSAAYVGTPDEKGDHSLTGNLVAKLHINGPVNIKQFGAQANTANNQASFIQAAIDSYQHIFIPAGSYNVDTIIIQPTTVKSYIIEGEGAYNSKLGKYGSSTTPVINMHGTAGGGSGNGVVSKNVFRNFGIDGVDKTVTGMKTDTLAHWYMEGVIFEQCALALDSLGSLIYTLRNCYFVNNANAYQAGHSFDNGGYSNLIAFHNCVFLGNTGQAAILKRGQNITFNSCDFEGNGSSTTTAVYISPEFTTETGLSSVSFNSCWWESNGSPEDLHSDANDLYINLQNCTFYNDGSANTKTVYIGGLGHILTIDNCYGNADLNIADTQARVAIGNSQFPNFTNSSQGHYKLVNLMTNSGSLNGETFVAVNNTTDSGSGAVMQADGMVEASNGYLGKDAITINGTPKAIVDIKLIGSLVFVNGYNTSGGSQGWWLLASGPSGITVIQSDDQTGSNPQFTNLSGSINMSTTSGTLVVNATALL